jgi:hypothetical protein
MQQGGAKDKQDARKKNASTKEQIADSLRRKSLAAVNADQKL